MAEPARLALACHCGATLTATVRPAEHTSRLATAFRAMHRRPVCGPATMAQAAAARRREARRG